MDHLKIRDIHYHPYEVPLVRPFTVNSEIVSRREGIVIQMVSDQGAVGLGDAAPLPGMSPEPLKKTIHQLERLKEEIRARHLPLDRDGLLNSLRSYFADGLIAPSVRFGVESAFVSMAASSKNISVARFLGQADPPAVFCSGLLQGGYHDVRMQLMGLRAKGYKTFHLKVGNRNIPLDIQKVEGVKELLPPQERLRISADGRWSAQEAVLFARAIGKNQVDFLEEPCPDLSLWESIYGWSDMPLAIGESLSKTSTEILECSQAIGFVIVRPMIFGGISGFCDILNVAKDTGKKVIVGGAFESGVGLLMLANLAALTGQAADLGCSAWMKTDFLAKPLASWGGMIPPGDLPLDARAFSASLRARLDSV